MTPHPQDPPAERTLPLRLPSGRSVYDALMAKIEPELVIAAIPGLAEKYKDETPEQNTERKKRYREAFAAYDRAFAALTKELRKAVQECRRNAFLKKEKTSENTSLLSALSTITDFPA